MVRINLIHPKKLADQHLIAEYNEILMLIGHIDKHPTIKNQPKQYCLGKGHINFFKNKINYLKKRHETIKKEMKKRNFKTQKTIQTTKYPKYLKQNWTPKLKDYEIIKKRIKQKINKKPKYYKYYSKNKPKNFFIKLLE